MVEELVGKGQHYRDFLQGRGFDLDKFDKLFFKQDKAVDGDGTSEEGLILEKLANLPDFNDRSLRVTNVINTDGSDLHLFLVPKECPRLMRDKYPETDELPPADQSYLVETFRDGDSRVRHTVVVLANDPDGAARIAKSIVGAKVSCPREYINAQALLVPPCEWA